MLTCIHTPATKAYYERGMKVSSDCGERKNTLNEANALDQKLQPLLPHLSIGTDVRCSGVLANFRSVSSQRNLGVNI